MSLDPLNISGGEMLRNFANMGHSKPKENLLKPKPSITIGNSGGGGKTKKRRLTDEEMVAQSFDEELIPETIIQEVKPEPRVILTHLKWGSDKGFLEEEIKVSVQAELPPDIYGYTRIIFTLEEVNAVGKSEKLKTKEGHLHSGIAVQEFTLPHSEGKNSHTEKSRQFQFTAKHYESKVYTSKILEAHVRIKNVDDLELEFEESLEFKNRGYTFRLKDLNDHTEFKHSALAIKEKQGKSILTFGELNPSHKFTLELLDKNLGLIETIFENKEHGKWD